MPSHFSTIGFDLRDQEDFVALANRVGSAAETIACANGRYLCWNRGRGEELWLQVDHEDTLIGMNPHFSGKASLRVGLQSRVHRDADTSLDGAFHGWADPQDASSDSGVCPLVFDAPDASVHGKLRLPSIVTVQIAAFAHEISIHASLADYEASREARELKFASRSFITSGLFSPDGTSTEPPQAHAIFTGHVLESATRSNALTGNAFHWALVETLGGSYDVVIDPHLSPLPRPGGVLSGSFWLSGRVLSYQN
jgi:hypothetical protein